MILKLGFLLLYILISCTTAPRLSQKHPYGLLTSDYGILNEDDLGVYAWWAEPTPFGEEALSSGYMYWQCFPTRIVKLECQKVGSYDPKDSFSDADIRIETEMEIHEYGFRRAVELEVCHAYLKNWKRLTMGENAVCFGGNVATIEEKKAQGRIKKKIGWIYDKLKTKKGCYAYFGGNKGDCDIEYWREQGYPHSKSE